MRTYPSNENDKLFPIILNKIRITPLFYLYYQLLLSVPFYISTRTWYAHS